MGDGPTVGRMQPPEDRPRSDHPSDDASPFVPADPERGRARRVMAALLRLGERHAPTADARARSTHPTQLSAQEALSLVAVLAAGSLPVEPGEAVVDAEDLLAALTLVPAARSDLDQVEASLLAAARGRGLTWAEIAFGLGLRSAQAAQQRYERLAGRTAPPRDQQSGPPARKPDPSW